MYFDPQFQTTDKSHKDSQLFQNRFSCFKSEKGQNWLESFFMLKISCNQDFAHEISQPKNHNTA